MSCMPEGLHGYILRMLPLPWNSGGALRIASWLSKAMTSDHKQCFGPASVQFAW